MSVQGKSLRVHYLQHVPFEGPGYIESWALARGHRLTSTPVYDGKPLPQTESFDWLVVLGGPMGVYDEKELSWLTREKRLIGEALPQGKTVIGICLGAQLMACVLGARVSRNPHREIGWFPVESLPENISKGYGLLPARFEAFHWHGDTFDIPRSAVHLSRSSACENQAFLFGKNALALQFHLESTLEGVRSLVTGCAAELTGGEFIQTPDEMLAGPERFRSINGILMNTLDRMAMLPSLS